MVLRKKKEPGFGELCTKGWDERLLFEPGVFPPDGRGVTVE